MALTQIVLPQPTLIRSHLVDAHGYSWPGTHDFTTSQLRAQHNRLHEDPTAKHLDHSHTPEPKDG